MIPDHLFEPFRSPGLDLPNRVVMAPMTRCFSPDGVPGDDVVQYYRRRAEGGAGLIISEGAAIDEPAAVTNPRIPRFHGEEPLDGWQRIVDAVHAAGSAFFPQLWHTGAARQSELSANPEVEAISPSGLFAPGQAVGRAMTDADIERLVAAYGQGAEDAKRLGCDGIELHFAHGYLVDQFFWPEVNLRADAHGADRYLLAEAIVAECRRRVGPGFPIGLRFSQWKQQDYDARIFANSADLSAFLTRMVDAGVTIFHCSSRRFWEPEFEGEALNLAGWTKKLTGVTVITVGSVGLNQEFLVSRTGVDTAIDESRLEALNGMLARGEFDLVAIGRALLADPLWPRKVRAGRFENLITYSKDAERTLA